MFDRISLAIFAVPLVLASATYTYDNGGRLIKVDYGAAGSVTYTYDSAGHLTGRQLAPSTSVTVSSVTSSTANGTYGAGAAISIQVSLSAPVNVTGVPQLALNSGGTANYSSGSGSANLTFTYTIAAAQSSTRLDYTSTTALTLNGGTIKDSSGNAANLTLPTPGATGSLSSNKNIVISTAAVTFTITAPSPVAAGTAFNFTVTAKDTSGNTATAYSGTLHFSSTDSSATLPANTTLSSGVGTFAATLRTTGNQTITAIDTVTPSITGTSSTISVAAPPVASVPGVVSISPAVSNGSNQILTFTFSESGGWQNLSVVNVLINNFLDGRQACYIAFVPSGASAGTLYLIDDAGDAGGPYSGMSLPANGAIHNSQCSISGSGSSVSGSGNNLTLTLNFTFSPTFGGNRVIYAAARDAQNNSGWQTMGVHGVPPFPSTFPNPVGMTPSFGNSLAQTITFTYQDQSDASNLETVWALINTALDGRAACYVAYYRPGNQLFLYPDNGDGSQATNITLTGNNTTGNSQCTISAQGSSLQANGNTLTVSLAITFKTAFAGFKDVWMADHTLAGATSPWQALGSWVVPGQ